MDIQTLRIHGHKKTSYTWKFQGHEFFLEFKPIYPDDGWGDWMHISVKGKETLYVGSRIEADEFRLEAYGRKARFAELSAMVLAQHEYNQDPDGYYKTPEERDYFCGGPLEYYIY